MNKRALRICTVLTLLVAVTISLIAVPVEAAHLVDHVVINEFEIKPPGKGSSANKQWVEIYNPTASSINLTGWKLTTRVYKKTILFPANTILGQNRYYVYDLAGVPFAEKKEQIILKDAANNEVDRTPIVDESSRTQTWQRYPNGVDTGADPDWKLQLLTKWSTNGGETITCTVAPTSVKLGEEVTIAGTVDPGHRTYVQVLTSAEGTAGWKTTIVETTDTGSYSFTWKPPEIATYNVKAVAIWDGDATSSVSTFTVTKLPSEVIVTPPSNAAVDRYSSIVGYINPIHKDTPITLTVGLPNGTVLTYNLQTTNEGFFNHTFKVKNEGTFNVTASWAGDATYDGAQSPLKFFPAEGLPQGFSPVLALMLAPVGAVLAIGLGLALRKGAPRPSLPRPQMKFFERQIANPKPPKPAKPQVYAPRCTKCGSALTYVPQIGRNQCPYCKKVF